MKRVTTFGLFAAALAGVVAFARPAVGHADGELEMMGVAGLSVAYRAKPRVRAQASVAIDMGGLDRLLEVVLPTD